MSQLGVSTILILSFNSENSLRLLHLKFFFKVALLNEIKKHVKLLPLNKMSMQKYPHIIDLYVFIL